MNRTADLFWELIHSGRPKEMNILLDQISISVKDFGSEDWIQLDEAVRKSSPYYASLNMREKNPAEFVPENSTLEKQVLLLGLCSMHPVGFFREKALNLLGKVRDGSELPFLLLRLKDWAGPVRSAAEKMLRERLSSEYSSYYIQFYHLVLRAGRSERAAESEIFTGVSRLLSQEPSLQYDSPALLNFSQKIRNEFIINVIFIRDYEKEDLKSFYRKETQPFLKYRILIKYLEKENLDTEELKDLFRISAPLKCRILILEKLRNFKDTVSSEFIRELIFSRFSYVRKMAREASERNGKNDFRKIYLDHLNIPEKRLGAVGGLSETGNPDDVIELLDFLESEDARIRNEALLAAAGLSPSELKPVILDFLSNPETSNTAFRTVSRHRILALNSDIEKIFLNTENMQIQKNCLKLLLSSSKWDSLLYILRYLKTEGETGEICRSALDRWLLNFNKSFILPDSAQKERILSEIPVTAAGRN
ncbi:MAG TPA: hypothetical protein PL048_15670, partial [Leptospiraceae bacterium]|nr:hypothetical protein [Leptospiraceae bacterium]